MGKSQRSNASALHRLKKSLVDAGVVGNKPGKKIQKSKNKVEIKAKIQQKLQHIHERFNSFDLKHTQQKQNILGRKVKGVKGKPAATKLRSEENRKKTMLVEYRQKNKAGNFHDLRLGEANPNMSIEEKMTERAIKERQKMMNKDIYNLEEDVLTHFGQSLAEMDEYKNDGLGDSDAEDLDKEMVQQNFGGFEKEDGSKKTKQEVMQEIIAKSKFYKQERLKEKEENEALREKLDDELDDIRQVLLQGSKMHVKRKESSEPVEKDEYDKAVREFMYDKRSQPTNRTKTDEEKAIEEKENLEKLEANRLRRMKGISSDDETFPRRAPVGDDLDPDDYYGGSFKQDNQFSVCYDSDGHLIGFENPSDKKKSKKDQHSTDKKSVRFADDDNNSATEEESEEDSENETIEDSASDLEFECALSNSDHEDEQISNDDMIPKRELSDTNKKLMQEAKQELSYTFEVPKNHEAFLSLIHGWSLENQMTIVKRIRILYSVHVCPQNASKLIALLQVLLDHILYLSNLSPIPVEDIEAYVKPITELIQEHPQSGGDYLLSLLDISMGKLKATLSKVQTIKTAEVRSIIARALPSTGELLLLSLIGDIFSTSDFQHSIVTPAMLLMGHYLESCIIQQGKDALVLIYLCNLFHKYQKMSKRIVPEVLNTLCLLTLLITPSENNAKSLNCDFGVFPIFPFQRPVPSLQVGKDMEGIAADKIHFATAFSAGTDMSFYESGEFRVSLVKMLFQTIERFVLLYESQSSFCELFSSLYPLMQNLVSTITSISLESNLDEYIKKVFDKMEQAYKVSKSKKSPITLQKFRPIPIPSLIPKFEENYSLEKRKKHPNQMKAEEDKLKYQHKMALKGAVRELRKDANFLAKVELQKIKEKDQEYQEKMKRIMGLLSEEQGETNKENRKKKRKKF